MGIMCTKWFCTDFLYLDISMHVYCIRMDVPDLSFFSKIKHSLCLKNQRQLIQSNGQTNISICGIAAISLQFPCAILLYSNTKILKIRDDFYT